MTRFTRWYLRELAFSAEKCVQCRGMLYSIKKMARERYGSKVWRRSADEYFYFKKEFSEKPFLRGRLVEDGGLSELTLNLQRAN